MNNFSQKPTLSEIMNHLNSFNLSVLPKVKIQILRNITLEPIEPFLKYYSALEGFNAEINFGRYDSILNDTSNSSGDIIFIFLLIENFSQNLSFNFNSLSENQIESEKKHLFDYISVCLSNLKKNVNSPIIITDFPEPIHPSLGLFDNSITNGQSHLVQDLNVKLRNFISSEKGVYVFPLNKLASKIGYDSFFDDKQWNLSKLPFSKDGLCEIAKVIPTFINGLKGKTKKCLVLDCDNVLWGGVLGEDGEDGIKIGKNHPGSAYLKFQQEIINLYHRGIIIALCSKNNEHEVINTINSHPDILLREKYISAYRINWDPKDKNIVELSKDLNIGLESMVFIDDSKFEIELIKKSLPMIDTIDLSEVKPSYFYNILKDYRRFDSFSISKEDKNRGKMYKEQTKRIKANLSFSNINDYLKYLKVEIRIEKVTKQLIPRISQLTQRTNQFNLNIKRYSESEIEEFKKNKKKDVLVLSLKDKFGDLGVVGTAIIFYENNYALIDSFLISCRALGRKIESIFFQEVLNFIGKKRKLKKVYGVFTSDKKNFQTLEFYKNFGKTIDRINSDIFLRNIESKIFIFDFNKLKLVDRLNYKIELKY